MANRKKCVSLGLRLAQSVYSTQYQRQVLPLTYLSQYSAVSEQFKTQKCTLNSPKNFFSSSPLSVVEVLLSNDWPEVTKKQLEESNIEISHEFVVYVPKKLDKYPQKALEFFNWACREKSFQPNTLTYRLLVRVLADLRSMKQFWGAIEEMLEKGFYLDEGTYMTIAGRLQKAKLDKDVIALKHFNQRMIQENAKDDEGTDMVKLILDSDWNEEVENKLHYLKIDVTDNLLIRVLKKIRHDPLKAYHFFEWVGKCQGCQQSSFAYNVMARILAQSDTIKEFQNVIMDMRSKGHGMDYDTYIKISRSLQKKSFTSMSLRYDLLAFTSQLERCSTAKNLPKLQVLHAGAIKLGFSHREFLRSKLVSAYASCAQMYDAHLIFSFCNSRSSFHYNALIRGHCSLNNFHLSLSVFSQMLAAQKPVDCYTLPAVLKSIAGLSALSIGRRVHVAVLVNGFESDAANCNALITMYAKCGDLVYARKVFDVMPVRNTVSWSALIGGYGMHGRFLEVSELFERMIDLRFRPDAVAFTTVLAACSHGGFVEKGKEYFELMKERFGIRPNMVHYTCMVDMFARAGRMEEAKQIIESMDMEPDEAVLRALHTGPAKFIE